MAVGIEIQGYHVDHWLPEDRGPGVVLAVVQDRPEEQLHLLMTQPLAWQIASRILALLDMPPLTPDDPRFAEI